MGNFTLTFKNYRCFEESRPLVLEVHPGFTALVGPNNSGKSTAIKAFYEFQQLFNLIGDLSQLPNLIGGGRVSVAYQGADDPVEVFPAAQDRPVSVGVDFPVSSANTISRIVLTAERHDPSSWRGAFHFGPHRVRATSITFRDTEAIVDTGERREDANPTWAKEENWRIAREMAKHEVMATDVGTFLAGL